MHEKIRHIRKSLGLTQDDVAEALSVTKASVSRWESDKEENKQSITLDNLKSVAKLFGVTTDSLLFDELNIEGRLERYALDEAPTCESSYELIVDANDLDGVMDGTVFEVVKWQESLLSNTVLLIFRVKGHKRASVLQISRLGDELRLTKAVIDHRSTPRNDPIYRLDDGDVLGIVRNIVHFAQIWKL